MEYTISVLREKVSELERDKTFYTFYKGKPNQAGVSLSDTYRAERVTEIDGNIAELNTAIEILQKEN